MNLLERDSLRENGLLSNEKNGQIVMEGIVEEGEKGGEKEGDESGRVVEEIKIPDTGIEMPEHVYQPSIILEKKDLLKKDASMFIVTKNRSAGKTFNFLELSVELFHQVKRAVDLFKTDGHQTALLYRYSYELSSASAIFKDVLDLYPQLGQEMTCRSHAKGLFYELILDGKTFGFAVALSNPDGLKKYSPIFAKVGLVLMDEYQSETGKYLTNEIKKYQSVLFTIARGRGKQSRSIKVVLLGNMVTIMNPYFIFLGIHKRLRNDTKFMRGKHWIAEFGMNEAASQAIKDNDLFDIFSDDDYFKYSTESVYLVDSTAFIAKPKGTGKYIATIVVDGYEIGAREFITEGIIYMSNNVNKQCTNILAFKPSDHNQTTTMISRYSERFKLIKDAYMRGMLRFDDLKTKNAIFDILAVDIYK